MSHFSVNAVRPMVVYILGVILLCALGWSIAQNMLVVPYELRTPYQKEIALGMFGAAALFGISTILKNVQRAERPWAVPRAQVNRHYALFFVITLCAVLIAK